MAPLSRPTRALLVAALALSALAAPVHADEVQRNLTGKVLTVSLGPAAPAGLGDALDNHGVKVGAAVNVSFSVESTTPAGTGVSPDYTYYFNGITSLTIQIGSYTAMLQVPPGFEMLNITQVGDNVPGQQVSDSVIMSTPGIDTDMLLHGANPGTPTLNLAVFDFSGANASNDEGIVQDFTKYDFGNAVVGGAYGSINITLDLGKGGGGGGKSIGPGFCRKLQMLAAGKFGKKLLMCAAKASKQPPQKDPLGEKLAICNDKAAAVFEKQFSKGVFKSVKKGSMCTLTSLGSETVTTDLQAAVDAIIGPVLLGEDPDEKKDRALRSKLLRAAGAQWLKDSAAYARDTFKPSPEKLAKKLDKSRAVTEARVAKALKAAEKQGLVYTGPDGPALADAVRGAVEDFLAMTGGTPATE